MKFQVLQADELGSSPVRLKPCQAVCHETQTSGTYTMPVCQGSPACAFSVNQLVFMILVIQITIFDMTCPKHIMATFGNKPSGVGTLSTLQLFGPSLHLLHIDRSSVVKLCM